TVIEAMAVGLPCISTPVAGIPELLEPEDMIAPTDVEGFADRIIDLLSDPETMEKKSARNIAKAKEYSDEQLQNKRNAFYGKLRLLAEHP
ncbi:MAG: glycosyltransferase family 4 protein, partial [Eubacteriales bacterium]|nr:glycosyltransferase family 4 protein [Eubacteriales bacterium]